MLTVTKAALERLSRRLSLKKAADDVAMRFTRRTGGWRLRLGRTGPDDTAFAHEGRNVLLLDKSVSSAMANMKLDVKADEADAGLKLRRIRGLAN